MHDKLNFCVKISEDELGIDVSVLDVTFYLCYLDPEKAKECLEDCTELFDIIDSYDGKNDEEFLNNFEDAATKCVNRR